MHLESSAHIACDHCTCRVRDAISQPSSIVHLVTSGCSHLWQPFLPSLSQPQFPTTFLISRASHHKLPLGLRLPLLLPRVRRNRRYRPCEPLPRRLCRSRCLQLCRPVRRSGKLSPVPSQSVVVVGRCGRRRRGSSQALRGVDRFDARRLTNSRWHYRDARDSRPPGPRLQSGGSGARVGGPALGGASSKGCCQRVWNHGAFWTGGRRELLSSFLI